MKSTSQDQSLSDSRELDRSYDPLTGRRVVMSLLAFFVFNSIFFFNDLALFAGLAQISTKKCAFTAPMKVLV